ISKDALDCIAALKFANIDKGDIRGEIPYRIDGRYVRLRIVILNASLANRDVHAFIPQVLVVGYPTHSNECFRDGKRSVAAIVILKLIFYLAIFYFKPNKPGIAVDQHTIT